MNTTPRHIAIIMDGNGRWAQQRGLSRSYGHEAGVNALSRTVQAALEVGIEYLTVYAFSAENWERPTEEVNKIMSLLAEGITQYTPIFIEYGVRLWTIGDIARLPEEIQEQIQISIEKTASGKRLTLAVALSYSSQSEIAHAVSRIARDYQAGQISDEELSSTHLIDQYLYTTNFPPLDLMIRTGGDKRLSNFLLLQSAYTELYFTDKLWPDFDKDDLLSALEDFSGRQRRFGRVLSSKEDYIQE